MRAYVEYLDDRVCFFAAKLEQGRTTVRYQLRAETLGKFSAAPAKIGAMYAPELKAPPTNSCSGRRPDGPLRF